MTFNFQSREANIVNDPQPNIIKHYNLTSKRIANGPTFTIIKKTLK